ncbi:MAG: VWA domain-containing protein [Acidobacteriia bacterium]|nr:VWA domain-containing protein [Terriglobia bacterium]
MISRRDLLAAFAAAPFIRAQEKISTDVNVVNVFATVRNKQGQIVRDLNQDDFLLDEDGRPQTIAYFARESDLPLTLGLVVDTSPSQRLVLEQERGASFKFFDQVLREDQDQAFMIHFDAEVELLQDLTNSRKKLQDALRELETAAPRQLNRRDAPNPGQRRPRGGTALYDAVLLASDEVMKKQTGRKALVVLSDGVDNASRTTLSDAIASAERSGTLVYCILFAGEERQQFGGGRGMGGGRRGGMGRYPQQPRGDGKKVLERLAKETGGGFFEGSKKQSLDDIYRQIQEELRNQYSLGYSPDKSEGPGFRKIHVATKQKGFTVQARDGYYAIR